MSASPFQVHAGVSLPGREAVAPPLCDYRLQYQTHDSTLTTLQLRSCFIPATRCLFDVDSLHLQPVFIYLTVCSNSSTRCFFYKRVTTLMFWTCLTSSAPGGFISLLSLLIKTKTLGTIFMTQNELWKVLRVVLRRCVIKSDCIHIY